jgi:crotonobetainyl-CoA:carnitine CoA-transferase CaiB-like acyl-CoA transferase
MLARRTDIILEGFRPGVVKRLGIGYSDIASVNPSVIYCSITGYGQEGPLSDQAGHDVNYLGYSGVLSLIGRKNGPPCIPGIQIADISGGLNAAIAILMALYHRGKTGAGRYIDVSMTDSLMAMLSQAAGQIWESGSSPERGDSLLSHRFACYNVYRTQDDRYITLAALEMRFWESLCRYFSVPEFISLQYEEKEQDRLITFFKKTFLSKTRDAWVALFSKKDVCLGPVLTVPEAQESEYARARNTVVETTDSKGMYRVLGLPFRFSGDPQTHPSRPPAFGENTAAILEELGFSEEEIRKLARKQVI